MHLKRCGPHGAIGRDDRFTVGEPLCIDMKFPQMTAVESKIIRSCVHKHSERHAVHDCIHIARVVLVQLAVYATIVVRHLRGRPAQMSRQGRRVQISMACTGEHRNQPYRLYVRVHDARPIALIMQFASLPPDPPAAIVRYCQ